MLIETGSCFCGEVAAEFEGPAFWCCTDHDDDCRKAVGAPMNLWIGFRPHQVRFTRGDAKTFSKTPGISRSFCATCGTSIGYLDTGLADEVYVTAGFLDHPERFAPLAHAYWPMRLPWIEFTDDLPRVDGVSRTRDPRVGNPADRRRSD